MPASNGHFGELSPHGNRVDTVDHSGIIMHGTPLHSSNQEPEHTNIATDKALSMLQLSGEISALIAQIPQTPIHAAAGLHDAINDLTEALRELSSARTPADVAHIAQTVVANAIATASHARTEAKTEASFESSELMAEFYGETYVKMVESIAGPGGFMDQRRDFYYDSMTTVNDIAARNGIDISGATRIAQNHFSEADRLRKEGKIEEALAAEAKGFGTHLGAIDAMLDNPDLSEADRTELERQQEETEQKLTEIREQRVALARERAETKAREAGQTAAEIQAAGDAAGERVGAEHDADVARARKNGKNVVRTTELDLEEEALSTDIREKSANQMNDTALVDNKMTANASALASFDTNNTSASALGAAAETPALASALGVAADMPTPSALTSASETPTTPAPSALSSAAEATESDLGELSPENSPKLAATSAKGNTPA